MKKLTYCICNAEESRNRVLTTEGEASMNYFICNLIYRDAKNGFMRGLIGEEDKSASSFLASEFWWDTRWSEKSEKRKLLFMALTTPSHH